MKRRDSRIIAISILLAFLFAKNTQCQQFSSLAELNEVGVSFAKNSEFDSLFTLMESEHSLLLFNKDSVVKNKVIYYAIISFAYNITNQNKNCILSSEKGIELIESTNSVDSEFLDLMYFHQYCHVGYSKINDYYKSILYANRALSHIEKKRIKDSEFELSALNTLAVIQLQIKNPSQAIKTINALLIRSQRTIESKKTAFFYQNLSNSHQSLHNYDSAIYYLDKALAIYENDTAYYRDELFNTYSVAARRQLLIGNVEQSKHYFQKASSYYNKDIWVHERAYFLNVQAGLHAHEDKFDLATKLVDSALHILSPARRDDLTRTNYPSEYFDILSQKIQFYETQAMRVDADDRDVKKYAIQAQKGITAVRQIMDQLPSDALKHIIIQKAKPLYYHAIMASYLIKDVEVDESKLTDVGKIFEDYHAQLIKTETSAQAWISNNQPKATEISEYLALQHEYDSILHESAQLPFSEEPSSSYITTTTRLYETEEKVRAQKNKLRRNFPQFDAIYSQHETLSKEEIKLLLNRFDNIISYFFFENKLFILEQNNDAINLSLQIVHDTFTKNINDWINMLSSAEQTNLKYQHELGKHIYENIFAPIEKSLGQHILIIADDAIASIPFAALNRQLPSNSNNFIEADYLLRAHQIAYHSSSKLAAQMIAQPQNRARARSYSFTPNDTASAIYDYITNDTIHLPPLPYSLRERLLMRDYFGTKQLTTAAAIDSFQTTVANSSMLHIGGHVVLNDQFPEQSYIPLSGIDNHINKISAYTFQEKELDIDLIIMTACHGGIGKSQSGRGMTNFVSGFVRAKVKSILSARWEINDKLSFDFLSGFFLNLKDGQTANQSLRNAQLHLLQKNDPMISNPSVWSSLYLIGDPDVNLARPMSIWWKILIAFVALLLFMLGRRHLISVRT